MKKAQESAVSLRSKSKIEIVDAEIKAGIDERNKGIEAAGKADAKPADAKPEDKKPEDKKPEEKK